MPQVRFFGQARELAGVSSLEVRGASVAQVTAELCARFGEAFERVLATSRIWSNGNETSPETTVAPDDEIAVLPPVSGGS